MRTAPSRSLGSNSFPGSRWSFTPSGITSRTTGGVAVRSTIASALFSCSVTHAVEPSVATYSGSRSCETLAFGPKMRTPASRSATASSSNAAKPTSITVGVAKPPLTSITEIEPTGSIE